MLTFNDHDIHDYHVNSIITLIEIMRNEKVLNRSTATNRKSSARTVLIENDLLSESELMDFRTFNIEEVIQRFKSKNKEKYSPDSMQTHCSHARRAVAVIKEYNEDPSKFLSNFYETLPTPIKRNPNQEGATTKATQVLSSTNQINNNNLFTFDLPVPIRDGKHMVTISNIPKDIKEEDVKRISAVIRAYSNE